MIRLLPGTTEYHTGGVISGGSVMPFLSTVQILLVLLSHLTGKNVQFIFSRVAGLRVAMDNLLSGEGFSSERQHNPALPPPHLQGNALLYFFKQVILLAVGIAFSKHAFFFFFCKTGLQKPSINRILLTNLTNSTL